MLWLWAPSVNKATYLWLLRLPLCDRGPVPKVQSESRHLPAVLLHSPWRRACTHPGLAWTTGATHRCRPAAGVGTTCTAWALHLLRVAPCFLGWALAAPLHRAGLGGRVGGRVHVSQPVCCPPGGCLPPSHSGNHQLLRSRSLACTRSRVRCRGPGQCLSRKQAPSRSRERKCQPVFIAAAF